MIEKIIAMPILLMAGALGIIACGGYELIRLPFTIFIKK
jgi:hypothetical protein